MKYISFIFLFLFALNSYAQDFQRDRYYQRYSPYDDYVQKFDPYIYTLPDLKVRAFNLCQHRNNAYGQVTWRIRGIVENVGGNKGLASTPVTPVALNININDLVEPYDPDRAYGNLWWRIDDEFWLNVVPAAGVRSTFIYEFTLYEPGPGGSNRRVPTRVSITADKHPNGYSGPVEESNETNNNLSLDINYKINQYCYSSIINE